MISVEEIKQVQKAIGSASWRLDLWKFAEAVGGDASHDYTKDLFKQFSELSRAVNRFDAETLTKIVNA